MVSENPKVKNNMKTKYLMSPPNKNSEEFTTVVKH